MRAEIRSAGAASAQTTGGPVAATGRRRTVSRLVAPLAVVTLAVSILAAVAVGQADLSAREVWTVLTDRLGLSFLRLPALGLEGQAVSPIRESLIWELRVPRALAAVLVGGGLALVGAVMQTLTRNPMADPYLLGVSSGASLGAVSVIVAGLGAGTIATSGGAFLGAMAAFVLVLAMGRRAGRITPTRMVLAGVAVASLCGAATSFLILWVADPQATQEAQFWLSGSLAPARFDSVGPMAAVLLLALGVAAGASPTLNAFAFGEDAAAGLGVGVDRFRWVLLVVCALVTAVLVSVSGTIGFVGLLVPHAVRLVAGPDHRRLLPLSMLCGGLFLLWVDVFARTAFTPREVPVGVITAFVGVPVFLWVLRTRTVRG